MAPFVLSDPGPADKQESDFDRLLREANIPLHHASSYKMVKDWIYKNYRSKFVPQKILDELGIQPD